MTEMPAPLDVDEALRQPSIRLWRRLMRLTQGKIREVEGALSPLGLTPTEFDLLAVVRAHPGATQQELAQHMLFTEGNMTYHAQRLLSRGLIRREVAGRTKRLSLTPEGSALMDQALPVVVDIHEAQFAELTTDQLQQLEGLLRLLR
ncbi:MarR family transcriptional regulator [Deinococcus malanensis]|uniref:MarR family transcriptional regulator n=2 Tax=Deinococcus malanensis TaxID=1706855 RepID=A0ABQ2EZD6_9DEIO|nr:MarR family transcriptional regulator [Deinococcus malanensis]